MFVFWHDRWLSEIYFNRRPDDCTFFFRVVIFSGCNLNPLKNMSGQMSVPFFSGINFFQSYVSTIIGACVKIRTPITTRKNYDPPQKKVHSSGRPWFSFVFCAPTNDQTTVSFFRRSYFFSSFAIIGVRILTRQTVIWDLFQLLARQLYLFLFGL